METWRVPQGSVESRQVQIADGDGQPIAYSGSEPLSGDIWPGGTRASLVTLTPTWLSAIDGTTTVTITGAQTATLPPATYSVRLTVEDLTGVQTYYRGSLQITASPGATPVAPTYTDDDDLLTYAPWIGTIQAEGEQAGFALQCGQARAWLDGILISRWKVGGGLQLGDPGYGAFAYGGGAYNGSRDGPSKWLKDQLAADKLIVTDQVKEICAKRALYLICRSQLGCNGDHPYQDLARSFRFESEEMVKTYRGEIDLDGSGYASLIVNCGATNLR